MVLLYAPSGPFSYLEYHRPLRTVDGEERQEITIHYNLVGHIG